MKRIIFFSTLLVAAQAFAANNCSTPSDVKQADQRWQAAIATNDPATVAAVYTKNAVLIPTVENAPHTTQAERLAYFQHFFKTLQHASVAYNQEIIQMLPDGAVSSGVYTFKGLQDGKTVRIPARFTFVYEATPTGCSLITHHSSALPQ